MSSTILRQWLVLGMLPRPPRRTDTGSIEARLRERGIEVHRRTIQRDLLELAEVFPIVADERAKPYGWRWADDADTRMPIVRLHENEGVRVTLSLRVLEKELEVVFGALGSREFELVSRDSSRVTIAMIVRDSMRTRRALFGVADVAEVLAPPAWRHAVGDFARRILERQG